MQNARHGTTLLQVLLFKRITIIYRYFRQYCAANIVSNKKQVKAKLIAGNQTITFCSAEPYVCRNGSAVKVFVNFVTIEIRLIWYCNRVLFI